MVGSARGFVTGNVLFQHVGIETNKLLNQMMPIGGWIFRFRCGFMDLFGGNS